MPVTRRKGELANDENTVKYSRSPRGRSGSKSKSKSKATQGSPDAPLSGLGYITRSPDQTRPKDKVLKGKAALDYIFRPSIPKKKDKLTSVDQAPGDWLQQLVNELTAEQDSPLDQGAYLAPFDTAQANLAGAYDAAKAAINTQPASLRSAFAQMDSSALANQQAIQQQVAHRLAATQALQGAQAGKTVADLAAQGVSTDPVQQQAQLQAQALQGQNVNQAAVVGNQAAAQQAAGDRRESDTATLIGAALGQLEANRVGASGRIEAQRSAAMQRFAEMQLARQDALRQRKLDALNKVQEIEQYTSPAEEIREQFANSPGNPMLATAAAIVKDIDDGKDDIESVLAGLQTKAYKDKLRAKGIDPNRLASVLRAAYNNSAKKRARTLDQIRAGQ